MLEQASIFIGAVPIIALIPSMSTSLYRVPFIIDDKNSQIQALINDITKSLYCHLNTSISNKHYSSS